MTTQELKQSIEKVLGNNIRCLLPSYWWKRLFNQVADRIDEVEQSTSELIDASKMPIVESESNLSKLDLPKGSVAAVVEESVTVKISDCYFSENPEEDWEKYTIVKRVEEKANITIDKESAVAFSASKDWLNGEFHVGALDSGIFGYMRYIDGHYIETTLSEVNEALSSGNYRAIGNSGEPDQYFTFYSEMPRPELYIKGETWERLAQESDLGGIEGGSGDAQPVLFYAPLSENDSLDDTLKAKNVEAYNKIIIKDSEIDEKVFDIKISVDGLMFFDVLSYSPLALNDTISLIFNNATSDIACLVVSSDGNVVFETKKTVDSEMSTTSTNAVQNKVVTKALNNKVDKVSGKQLSTEDFTTALKTKLEGLNAFDPTEINNKVDGLQTQLNTLVSGDASTAIESFNEITAFLNGVTDSETLDGIIASIEQQIANKQDKLVSGTNIKTINGESILGEGNIVVNVDTSNLATKEEVTNLQNEVIANEEVSAAAFNEINERIEQLSENVSGAVTNLNGSIATKQDTLVSGTNIKTVNGESILGSGNIVIGGGSGGGEDIRYFTEFTVEDFIEACESVSTIIYDTTDLFNAMKSNKVICVPYRGYDKGFVVASYKSGEDVEYPSMYLQKGDVEYYAYTGDSYELYGEIPIYNSVQVVEMAGGEVVVEVLDNLIYNITDPVDYLSCVPHDLKKGATIKFISGEFGTTIEMFNIFWANGEIPQIEPNTCYELSLMQNPYYENNAVLTPFKQVE